MKSNDKVIFHIDLDAFFASCMQEKYQHLKNKPIVVSRDDSKSIITASSYEAKSLGIVAAMPIFKIKKLHPEVIIVQPDYEYIKNKSTDFKNTILSFTKKMESFSLDECYIDATDIWKKYGTVKNLAIEIQTEVFKKTGLTCSIGVSHNKFLAKMGSDLNKPNGVEIIKREEIGKKILPLDISKMYGIGRKTEKKLRELGINKISEILKLESTPNLTNVYNKNLLLLIENVKGNGDNFVDYTTNKSRTISKEKTLEKPTTDTFEIETYLKYFSKEISNELKEKGLMVKTIASIHRFAKNIDEPFSKEYQIKHIRKQETISNYTNEYETIFSIVKKCFNTIYDNKKPISLIGISVGKIILESNVSKQLLIKF